MGGELPGLIAEADARGADEILNSAFSCVRKRRMPLSCVLTSLVEQRAVWRVSAPVTEGCKPGKQRAVCTGAIYLGLPSKQRGRMVGFGAVMITLCFWVASCTIDPLVLLMQREEVETDQTSFIIS